MIELTARVKLLSDTLISSGEGQGALLDSDVVFDELGLPYIPARRFKGCLREAAREVKQMLKLSQLSIPFSLEDVFGMPGQDFPSSVIFGPLLPQKYEENRAWLEYLLKEQKFNFQLEDIRSSLTQIRYQTAVESKGNHQGVVKEHSLRTLRTLRAQLQCGNFIFEGKIEIPGHTIHDPQVKKYINTLVLAAKQLEDIGLGAQRKRGLGHVHCSIYGNNDQEIKLTAEDFHVSTAL